NMIKSFYTSSLLFDVLSVFGELSEENIQQRKYARWKATYIHTCLKEGETPVAGPLAMEGEEGLLSVGLWLRWLSVADALTQGPGDLMYPRGPGPGTDVLLAHWCSGRSEHPAECGANTGNLPVMARVPVELSGSVRGALGRLGLTITHVPGSPTGRWRGKPSSSLLLWLSLHPLLAPR
ncbi:unnamed protein product, partial [Boreogadus saida]